MCLATQLGVVQPKGQRCTDDKHHDAHLVPEGVVLFLQTDALIPLADSKS